MVIVLTGKSCSGKDSVRNILVNKYEYTNMISYTTRPRRNNERNGVEYWFIGQNEMNKLLNENKIIDYREYKRVDGTWGYGHTIYNIKENKDYIAIADLKGAKKFKEIYGNQCIIIYIDSSDVYRTKRASKRGDDLKEWVRRVKADDIDFNKVEINDIVDCIIKNETVSVDDVAYKIDNYISIKRKINEKHS